MMTGYRGPGSGRISKLYHNTGNGFNDQSSLLPNLPGISDGSLAWGDYDNDGWLDLVLTGQSDSEPLSKLYHNTGNGFADQSSLLPGLPGVQYSVVAWGDYDNDGRIDLILTGDTGSESVTRVYHNTGNGFVAISLTDTGLSAVSVSSVAFGDYDNDQKLDLILTGYSSASQLPISRLIHNLVPTANAIPTAPTSLSSQVSNGGQRVNLSWQAATDAQTPQPGLTYNLYVSDTPGGQNLRSPMADEKTGYRRVVQFGNSQATNFSLSGLTPGRTYYWSVQAIDGAFAGSLFAPEQSFSTGLLTNTQQPLQLITPLYNCQTGAFTFQTTGGDGSPIEYMAPAITAWTSNPRQSVDLETRTVADAQPITLVARQNGTVVRLVWDIRLVCPVGDPNQLRLLAPLYDCQSGVFTFQTAGGYGSSAVPIEYMAAGITAWTTNPNQFVDVETRTAADAEPLVLRVRQIGPNGEMQQDDYVWDIRAVCPVSLEAGHCPCVGCCIGSSSPSQTFEDYSGLNSNLTGVQAPSVAWGDYDNDGRLDLMLTGKADKPISKLYRNIGGGFEEKTNLIPALPQVSNSSIAWADFDNDGWRDLVLTGVSQTNGTKAYVSKLYHNTGNGFEDASHFPGIYLGSAAFGDFDNDGLNDLMLTGITTTGYSSKLYRNTGQSFTDVSDQVPSLPQMGYSSVSWADYNNDGKLDLLMTGDTPSGTVLKLYQNKNAKANTPPRPPLFIAPTPSTTSVKLFWEPGSDAQTPQSGLHYNIYLSDTPGGQNRLAPMADQQTGYRRVVQLGNTKGTSITITGLTPGKTYYWSVQAIDGAFAGSPFAGDQRFTMKTQARLAVSAEPREVLRAVAYPNPAQSEVTVRLEGVQGQAVKLNLINPSGQVVVERKLEVVQAEHQERLNLDGLPSGIYLMRINTTGQSLTLKVIKQ